MTEEDQIDQAPTLTSGGPGGSGVFSSESDTKSKIKMDDGCSEKSFIQKTEADKEDAPPTEEGGRQDGIKTPEAPKSSQPHSTVSSPRVKSSASGEIVFEAKKKKSKLLDTSTPDTHTVTFSVNIAMAIPTGMYTMSFTNILKLSLFIMNIADRKLRFDLYLTNMHSYIFYWKYSSCHF